MHHGCGGKEGRTGNPTDSADILLSLSFQNIYPGGEEKEDSWWGKETREGDGGGREDRVGAKLGLNICCS